MESILTDILMKVSDVLTQKIALKVSDVLTHPGQRCPDISHLEPRFYRQNGAFKNDAGSSNQELYSARGPVMQETIKK